MAIVSISTPQGPKTIRIASTTPSEEELRRIKEDFPTPSGQVSTYKVLKVLDEEKGVKRRDPKTEEAVVVEEEDIEEGVSGEIEDLSLRFLYGFVDTPKERYDLLSERLGEEALEYNPDTGNFIIDQSKITEEARMEYGLGKTGRIYADSPDVTKFDLIDLGGEAGPELAAGLATGILTMGWGLLPAMLMTGAASAGGKAVAEGVEWASGLNRQSTAEVAGMIATTGAIDAVAFGALGLAGKLAGRLWKGPGPEFAQERVDELMAMNVPEKLAIRTAKEEQKARYSKMLREGGNPTVMAATGKTLAARALQINELIIGNKKVARENERWVKDQVNKLIDGKITKEQYAEDLRENVQSIAETVRGRTVDPDALVEEIQSSLDTIILPILDDFEKAYVPGFKASPNLTDKLEMATVLFRSQSRDLYDQAYSKIKDYYFPAHELMTEIQEIAGENPILGVATGRILNNFVKTVGEKTAAYGKLGTAQKADVDNGALFIDVKSLDQFKAALRVAYGSPDLIGEGFDMQIGKMITKVDDILENTLIKLSREVNYNGHVAKPTKTHPQGTAEIVKSEAVEIAEDVARTGERLGGQEPSPHLSSLVPETTLEDIASTRPSPSGIRSAPGNQQVDELIRETRPVTFKEFVDGLMSGKTNMQIKEYAMDPAWDPVTAINARKGLELLKAARKHWSEGQEQYNNAAVNMLVKNAKNKFQVTDVSVWENIIKDGNPTTLKMFLDAVTPSPQVTSAVIRRELSSRGTKPSVIIDEAIELVKAGDLGGANRRLKGALRRVRVVDEGEVKSLEEITGIIDPTIARLKPNDSVRKKFQEDYLENLKRVNELIKAKASPEEFRNSARDSLAKIWIDRTKTTSTVNGQFNYGTFANKFFQLEKKTQDILFGNEKAAEIRKFLPEMYLMRSAKNELLEALPSFSRPMDAALVRPGEDIVGKIDELKAAVDAEKAMSESALLQTIKTGKTGDPNKLYTAIMENPADYDKLKAIVGEELLEAPGGFKDRALANIIYSAMGGDVSGTVIQNGSWGRSLKTQIDKLQENGALTTIYGKGVVDGLYKLADDAVAISDVPIKGMGGLAAASTGIAIMTAILSVGSLATMLGGAKALIGAIVLSRALRNRSLLRTMTSTTLSKKQYEEAIKAGADLPSWRRMRKDAPIIFAMNQAAQLGAREMGLILSSGLLTMPGREIARRPEIATAAKRTREVAGAFTGDLSTALAQQLAEDENREQQQTQGLQNLPSLSASRQALRELEERKLLGVQ